MITGKVLMADTGAGDGAEDSIAVIRMWGMGGHEAATTEEVLRGETRVGFIAGSRRRRAAFWESGEEEPVDVEASGLRRW